MRRLLEYRTALLILGASAAYAVAVLTVPYRTRGMTLRGTFLVLSIWGMIAYWRPAWKALASRGWPEGGLLYALMVWLGCASYALNMAIATFWRFAGQPYYIINNALFDVWIVLGIGALAIGVTVPDLFGKDVPPKEKLRLGASFFVMLVAVLCLTIMQPDLQPLAEMIRPYIDMGHDYADPDGSGPTRCD